MQEKRNYVDLFGHASKQKNEHRPLAERMRPQTLGDFVGQSHLLGPGKYLSSLVDQATSGKIKSFPSLILWGPPGTGKTTLAQLIALAWNVRFVSLSALTSGVKELRKEIEEARIQRQHYQKQTIIFIDEIHRFHKGQQDALLHEVETGEILLIGATTENPSFEINAALLSRCRVLRLERLSDADLGRIVHNALLNAEKGLGALPVLLDPEAEQFLVKQASGDARRALALLESAVQISSVKADGTRWVSIEDVAQALQQQVLLYDRDGEEHYHVVSAFIKSMRGSDPDAAVYWMARMLEAGEDPLFVLRRMVVFAAEDVGCADPQALVLAMATMNAVHFVGLPEAVLPMTQLALYLSTAPKSNTALLAYQKAVAVIKQSGALPVPLHLKDGHSGSGRALGNGKGYLYPHDFENHHVVQAYLPKDLSDISFYSPSSSGYEKVIAERLQQWRPKNT